MSGWQKDWAGHVHRIHGWPPVSTPLLAAACRMACGMARASSSRRIPRLFAVDYLDRGPQVWRLQFVRGA